jgi:mannose-6-phosphate isomerase-like protein (cupin superfamily)
MKTNLILLLLALTIAGFAQQPDTTQCKWNIKNCVNQFDSTKISPTKAGFQYWFADKNFINGRTLKMSAVKPHDSTHPPHKHIEDEFFFILEGTAMLYLNGDSVICKPYTSFYCPSMSLHGLRNAGETVLKYLVIKDYIPQKK